MNYTAEEKTLLTRVQRDIPLVPDPVSALARDTGLPVKRAADILARMKHEGVIRNISGIFNAASLGYVSSLVAFSLADADVDRAASLISSHPGVSHNYLRDHHYNLWFTLAVEGQGLFEKTVASLAAAARAREFLVLRNEKLFKLGVRFSLDGTGDDRASENGTAETAPSGGLSPDEKEAVRLLQADLPLLERPFIRIIEERKGRLDEALLLATGNALKQRGVLRRYSAVLRHRKAGYRANAMTAWKPESVEQLERAAALMKNEPSVSHLYARTVYPGKWEYPLFAMVHASDENELSELVSRFSRETGIKDYLSLKSLKEYKKERVAYFSDRFNEWNTGEMT